MSTNHDKIIIQGLGQNNLKNISLEIPKEKIVVFTGVSGSGKSSIVFDTVAAESQRQMNETYSAWIRGRLEKYEKPKVDKIENLSASVILDEPTTGLHASDIEKIMELLDGFVKRGNTVIVIEHNIDVMKQADYIIDVGPDGGTAGGQIVFAGTVADMVANNDGITARYIRKDLNI